jgi:high affinity sulfate transporter 1
MLRRGMARFLRIAEWLPRYQANWLKSDALAGMTLAAYAIPVSLAYAGLAGLPPQVGIYGYLLGGLGYALFGSSRQLAIGPTSAISLMVGGALAPIAGSDAARYGEVATLAGLIVGGLCVLAYAFRLSALTNFVSETILLGFKAGAAISIATTQLPALLGVPGGGDHLFSRLWVIGSQFGSVSPAALAVGLIAMGLLVAGDVWFPGRPVALGVVTLAIIAVAFTPLGELGLALVGSVPAGLPALGLPELRVRDVDGLLPLAAGCVLLAYVEGVSAARTFAAKHDYELDVRQELLGLGGANLFAAVGGAYPVAGGLSQSAVNDTAGARTPLSLVFASLTLAMCLLFLTGLVSTLPRAVLAAVVLVAVSGLINLKEMRHLWRVSRFEFNVAMVAFAGVLLLGILRGVMVAAVVSILMLLRRSAYPHVAFLGRIPGSRRYSDLARHPDNELPPRGLIFRVESSLLYYNADHVRRVVSARARQLPDLRWVVADLSSAPYVDVAGARALAKISQELSARGIVLRLAETRADARDLLRAEGLEARVGRIDRLNSVADVVSELECADGDQQP